MQAHSKDTRRALVDDVTRFASVARELLERAGQLVPAAAANPEQHDNDVLRLLCDRLERADELARYTGLDARLEEMLEAITSMAAFDFSTKVKVVDGDDWIINAMAIGLNILGEELQRATRQLTETRDSALAANRAKTAFLANMSHELRTPLNAIIGYSELVREELRDGGPLELVRDLDYVLRAANHLLNLINDTLDLAKIESGKMKLHASRVDVRAMAMDVVGSLVPAATVRDNALVFVTPDDALSEIVTDELKLQQVLFNVLSNAIKFTEHGRVEMTFSTERHGGQEWAVFTVRDTGIGIPAEKHDVIFNAFRQVEEGSTRVYGGSGLGLAICQHFCRMMGGDITVRSVVGEGSTFRVRVPRLLVVAETDEADEDRPTRAETRSGSRYVLIIDADRDARALTRDVAESCGYLTCFADDASLVRPLALTLRPAFVFIDASAPGQDPWRLIATLRADSELLDTRVVLRCSPSDRERAIAIGVTDCLTRSVERAQIQRLLERHKTLGPTRVGLCCADATIGPTIKRVLERANLTPVELDRDALDVDVVQSERLAALIIDVRSADDERDALARIATLRGAPAFGRAPVTLLAASALRRRVAAKIDPFTIVYERKRRSIEVLVRALYRRLQAARVTSSNL